MYDFHISTETPCIFRLQPNTAKIVKFRTMMESDGTFNFAQEGPQNGVDLRLFVHFSLEDRYHGMALFANNTSNIETCTLKDSKYFLIFDNIETLSVRFNDFFIDLQNLESTDETYVLINPDEAL